MGHHFRNITGSLLYLKYSSSQKFSPFVQELFSLVQSQKRLETVVHIKGRMDKVIHIFTPLSVVAVRNKCRRRVAGGPKWQFGDLQVPFIVQTRRSLLLSIPPQEVEQRSSPYT